jgi:hypothetical protein
MTTHTQRLSARRCNTRKLDGNCNHEIQVVLVEGTVILTIDEVALMRKLGGKALKSKRGKSIAMNGLLKAQVKRATSTHTVIEDWHSLSNGRPVLNTPQK